MLNLLTLAALTVAAPDTCAGPKRVETNIPSLDKGISLFVLRVEPEKGTKKRGAVVFMHGAGSGGSAIWDIEFRDYSLMKHLAKQGFDTFAFDARGFGGSTMPTAMSQATEKNPPVVRASEVVRDLGAVVRYAQRKSGFKKVDLVAWSWGCVVSGMYAGLHARDVRRLVLYAPVYDRKRPKRHKTQKAWRSANRPNILQYFNEDREEWAVWKEHIDSMFRFAGGDDLRLPNGPYRDIYGPNAPIWDAAKVRAPTLIVRGDKDPASLHEHATSLYESLSSATERRYVVVAGADHYLPRERRYRQLQRLVSDWLTIDEFLVKKPSKP